MSKTIYIDCNRLNSIDSNSDNTAEWTYNLKDTLSIPAGSAIQIQNSFINQKGILGSSIEIEEDILESFSYYIYITEELKLIPAMVETTQCGWMDSLYALNTERLYGLGISGQSVGDISNRLWFGGSQLPMFLYDKINIGGIANVQPRVQTKQIYIKKGVYGINQLAELITDQINGNKTINNVPINPFDHLISDGIYNGNVCDKGNGQVQQGTIEDGTSGAGLTAVVPMYDRIGDLSSVQAFLNEFNNLKYNYIFIDAYAHQLHMDIVNYSPTEKIIPRVWNDASQPQPHVRDVACVGFMSDNHISAPPHDTIKHNHKKTQQEFQEDIDDYRLGTKGFVVGCPNFAISFDSNHNGYTINNLHEDYIIPSHDFLGYVQPNAGDIAVGYRNPATFHEDMTPIITGIGAGATNAINRLYSGLRKPVSRQGGALVYNFAVNNAKKFGDKDLTNIPETTLDNFKYVDYFTSPQKAKKAWSKCLWSRLGFSYEQLNDEKHFEEITSMNLSYKGQQNTISGGTYKNGLKMKGITTDAEMDISIVPTISTLTNPNVVGANGDISGYSSMKVWGGIPSNSPRREMRGIQGTNDNIASYRGSPYQKSTMDIVITRPKPIVADKLPTLSQFGYYLISSNIVAENDDIVQKGSPIPLLGVVPKSSLSSQDFISSENDIVHITTNQQVINNIKISVFNPDLTQPLLDDASAIVLKVTMPIIEPEPIKKSK